MTKHIETIVDDIYNFLDGKKLGALIETNWSSFGDQYASMLQQRFKHMFEEEGVGSHTKRKTVSASNFGSPCSRKLWYGVNKSNVGEPLPPNTKFKFLYGDCLEILLIELARITGHTVEGEQTELSINGVKGHRDVVIDGITVDVKSASSYSFQRFKSGLKPEDDKFGYLSQLGFYITAAESVNDPVVTDLSRGAFFVCDKQHGHICLDLHSFSDKDKASIRSLVTERKSLVSNEIPERSFTDVDDGKSGNKVLGTFCSYCEFKQECWPGLQQYNYANGPKFFTSVLKEPKVSKGF